MSAALFSTASSDKHCRRGRPSPARPRSLAGAREGQGREMPNQPPAALLNLTFTHSFTRNNNNLTLFGFLPYFCFCCLSLFLSQSLSTTPRLRERGRKGRSTGRMVPSFTERKAASPSQAKPTLPNDRPPSASFLSPSAEGARSSESIRNYSPKRGRRGVEGSRSVGRSAGRERLEGKRKRGRIRGND